MEKPNYKYLMLLKILVASILIGVIVSKVDMADVWSSFASADLLLIVGAFLLYFIGICITAARWKVLLSAQGVTVRFPVLVKSMLVAIFFNNFLPSTIGGDAMRAYDTWKFGGGKTQSVSIVLIDRFFGVFTLCIFALTALLTSSVEIRLVPEIKFWVSIAVVCGFIAIFILFFRAGTAIKVLKSSYLKNLKILTRPLLKIFEVFATYNGRPQVLIGALGLSILLQLNVILHYYLLALSLQISVPLDAMFIIIPVSIVVMMIPVSINAIGVREAIFVLMFGLYGVAAADALAFAWMSFLLITLLGVLGGIVFMLRKSGHRHE